MNSRSVLALWGWATLALVAGCSEKPQPMPAQLAGTNGMVVVGDLLFVTSSERNELRVIDLSIPTRDFVRAPNPIEPLSIPVMVRPVALARDVDYADGVESGGRYVFAYGLGSPEISIVGADRSELVELRRWVVAAPVTTLAARVVADGRSALFVATADDRGANLWALDVPWGDGLPDVAPPPRLLASLPGERIVSLVAMPVSEELAVATRGTPGHAGRSFILDWKRLTARTLSFPGPVRQLVTHGRGDSLPEGRRVFGVMDESECPSGSCAGIWAVESATGAVSVDATGLPMFPVTVGDGLIMGLALASDARVVVPGEEDPRSLSLLGLVTTSDGTIYFFDGLALRALDANPEDARASKVTYLDPEGNELELVGGPVQESFEISAGKLVDSWIELVYQGVLPGLAGLPTTDSDGQNFPVPPGFLAQVDVGDRIFLVTGSGSCPAELAVSAITATGLSTADPIPPACVGRVSFTVRAGGAKPYLVVSETRGFVGRTGPGATFSLPGAERSRPEGFDPSAPEIVFTFGLPDPAIVRDSRYRVALDDSFARLAIVADHQDKVLAGFLLPGQVLYYAALEKAYIAYPSANGVLEIGTATIDPNRPNSKNVWTYR